MSWPQDGQARTGPLAGMRILDLSRILAGPFATTILADLGADVVKVERAGEGDETRRWGPPYGPNGDAAYFYACNRGRRSVAVDLREADGRALVRRLAAGADVLVENFLPGAMDRLGLPIAELMAANPELVHCRISGYGTASARAAWPAFDFIIQAYSGIMGVTGPDPDSPTKAGIPIADLAAGLYAVIGILSAVRDAERTGRGTTVEVALADAAASLLTNQAMSNLIGGTRPRPLGNAHPTVAPYQTVRTADRLIAVAATSEVQFARLCAVLDLAALVGDERFATNADRVRNRPALIERVEARLVERPAAEWVEALNAAGVPAAVVNTLDEALSEPELRARMVTTIADGDDHVPQLRLPIWFDGAPLTPSGAPPALGQHTDAIANAYEEMELS